MSEGVRIVSFGGGVQTTALAILNARGEVPEPATDLVFADTLGEHQDTYDYMERHFRPWAAAHGLTLHVTARAPGLYDYAHERRMVPSINTRWCTSRFKIDPINTWLKEHGATRASPATVQVGISVDERDRARANKRASRLYLRRVYPLVDLGITRRMCLEIIASEGLPPPRKSGCWYCPYQRKGQWTLLGSRNPDLAAKAMELEARAQERNPRDMLGGYFRVRDLLAGGSQLEMDALLEADEGCTAGVCFV